ncbi:glycoside hydrolase family 3 C-terminal domain-containing protein [Actinospica sp. MGRD01-02]|uniref:Glycoside hydrolase family 3 C-terminal domain-containing protein n=1 Tax=Actinospica acidithermotolerans TaxID=2828514 RepID=A0A941E618_9ACTN|nr:glycoside hydrolase family 3 C-terminal domain-containing protein [Actinospica acidithermotolerans]MBR7827000.1 glycoside hydrolase family 3 C-terminal domain-containing protein [Actinospica acidithermotolerans]
MYLRHKSRRPKLLAAVTALSALTAAVCGGTASAAAHQSPVPAVTGDARVDRLLSEMTLDEKLSMIEGEAEVANSADQYQAGYLPGVARLGIPSLKLSDGPPGVITKQDSTGMTSTMGVAATFSTSDAQANGKVIGSDAKALGQDVVLEPFVNMDRDTSWGRGFNTFGEDPLLTGQTGAAEITGIQGQGEMAQVKHYIAYDGGNNVEVDSQTLQEIYLQPFDDAVQAGVSSVMCSYNEINGYQSCGNAQTLTSILRDELGFKGFVTSDWGADHGTTYINSGLDMEMPGNGGPIPGVIPTYFSSSAMKAAIASGSVQVSAINTAVGRILYEMDRFGLLTGASKHNVTPENTKADEATVLATAQDSATLLQNNGNALPLSSGSLSSLALIGPGAGQTIATNSGGEAAGGLLSQQTSALSALTADTKGTGANIDYAVADDLTGTPVPASALSHNGTSGLVRTTTGSSTTTVDPQLNFTTKGGNALKAGSTVSWAGTLTVPSTGEYWLNIQALGGTAGLTVDGKTLATVGAGFTTAPRYGVVHATDGSAPTATTDGLANDRTLVNLTAGAHTLSVTENPDASGNPVQVRLNWVTPAQQQANTDAAVAAARKAKTAVVFVWDTGSGDLSTALPDGQDQLIEKVAAVNPNTIVVLQANQPVAMPWLSSVKSVLDTYYGGDQAGVAAADLLLGETDPSGHLPFTWPKSLDQEVAHDSAHPERSDYGVDSSGNACSASTPSTTVCTTTYSEGLDIGYRYFDATNETPLYPFGYGLSYTNFAYSGMTTAKASDGGLNVTLTVRNSGAAAGTAVPQVYLGAPATIPTGVQFADKALAAYGRVTLAPGQSKTVTLHVPLRQLQYWTDASGWVTATGDRPILVSDNERGNQLSATVDISTK